MHGWLSIASISLLLLAGCVTPDAPAAPAAEAAPVEEDMAPLVEEDAPPIEMPIALDGNTGTAVALCLAPAAACAFQEIAPGTSGILLQGLAGRIDGGELVLSWTPASAATNELSFGFMTMNSAACDGVDLGTVRGASPLTLGIERMTRELCDDEVVHMWVAGNTWGDAGGEAYYQVDVDQPFRAEGSFTLHPPEPRH